MTAMNGAVSVDDETFGDHGRLGYIAPSTCERAAREFYGLVPNGVAMLIATLSIAELSDAAVDAALTGIVSAAEQLRRTGADVLFSAGIPLVLRAGTAGNRALREHLEAVAGCPVGTDLEATVGALRAVSAERIVVVSPFKQELHTRYLPILAEYELQVLADVPMGYDRQIEYGRLPDHAPLKVAQELVAKHPDSEAVYMPCGRIGNALELSHWEERLERPVVTANQAMIWWTLKQFGVSSPSMGGGSLLTRFGGL
jgi:maleate isomerase